jgi:hypothetical protein
MKHNKLFIRIDHWYPMITSFTTEWNIQKKCTMVHSELLQNFCGKCFFHVDIASKIFKIMFQASRNWIHRLLVKMVKNDQIRAESIKYTGKSCGSTSMGEFSEVNVTKHIIHANKHIMSNIKPIKYISTINMIKHYSFKTKSIQ